MMMCFSSPRAASVITPIKSPWWELSSMLYLGGGLGPILVPIAQTRKSPNVTLMQLPAAVFAAHPKINLYHHQLTPPSAEMISSTLPHSWYGPSVCIVSAPGAVGWWCCVWRHGTMSEGNFVERRRLHRGAICTSSKHLHGGWRWNCGWWYSTSFRRGEIATSHQPNECKWQLCVCVSFLLLVRSFRDFVPTNGGLIPSWLEKPTSVHSTGQ